MPVESKKALFFTYFTIRQNQAAPINLGRRSLINPPNYNWLCGAEGIRTLVRNAFNKKSMYFH